MAFKGPVQLPWFCGTLLLSCTHQVKLRATLIATIHLSAPSCRVQLPAAQVGKVRGHLLKKLNNHNTKQRNRNKPKQKLHPKLGDVRPRRLHLFQAHSSSHPTSRREQEPKPNKRPLADLDESHGATRDPGRSSSPFKHASTATRFAVRAA